MASQTTKITDTRALQEGASNISATGQGSKIDITSGNVTASQGSTVNYGVGGTDIANLVNTFTSASNEQIRAFTDWITGQNQAPSTSAGSGVAGSPAAAPAAATPETKDPIGVRVRAFIMDTFGVEEGTAKKILIGAGLAIVGGWLWYAFKAK